MKSLIQFLTVLLVCCVAVTAGAAGVDKGLDQPLRATPDSLSTFDLGDVTFALPTVSVGVPLTFTTTQTVTEIVNTITWVDSLLDFDGVDVWSGVDTTVVSVTVLDQTDNTVQFTINAGGSEFSIGTDPVAMVNFTPTCAMGYGAWAAVEFGDGANDNIYVSGGLTYSPMLDDGGISTEPEGVSHLWAYQATDYVGSQSIEWKAAFYQYTPGTLTLAAFEYDPTAVSFDSVTALDGLGGGSVSVQMHIYGTVVLDIAADVMPADVTLQLFTVHFSMLDDRDDWSDYVPFIGATRFDLCGDSNQPEYMSGGAIVIPNHTASADIYQINKYASADYYDVPFKMDSDHPVNSFKLWMEYPRDDLNFVDVIGVAGFTEPQADTSVSDPSKLWVMGDLGTDYLPEDLPATVFYLRFEPRSTPSVGDQFDIVFVDPLFENHISYEMELGGLHAAEITDLSDGYIKIVSPPPPPPCCPALYLWDGDGYTLENNILAECDGKRVNHNVTDFYLVTGAVIPDGDELRFQIREDATAVSEFENFELLAIDHPENEDIRVTRDGEIVTSGQPFSIAWARDHRGRDIKELISTPDNALYQSFEDGWFEVSLGKLHSSQLGPDLAATQYDSQVKKEPCGVLKSQGLEVAKSRKLKVSVRSADGRWAVISENDARHNMVRQSTVIDFDKIDPEQEVVLRYSWEGFYSIDVLQFDLSEPYKGDVDSPALLGAVHSVDGVVDGRLGADSSPRVTLSAGEQIDLVFDAGSLSKLPRGYRRDYIFVTKGRYEYPDRAEDVAAGRGFALDANSPNPFNPVTTITYSLPVQTRVNLSVYDVTGALVRTLVSGEQPAGEHSVVWDGLSGAGNPMASGVYFYRLATRDFVKTRKMLLLK